MEKLWRLIQSGRHNTNYNIVSFLSHQTNHFDVFDEIVLIFASQSRLGWERDKMSRLEPRKRRCKFNWICSRIIVMRINARPRIFLHLSVDFYGTIKNCMDFCCCSAINIFMTAEEAMKTHNFRVILPSFPSDRNIFFFLL